MEASGDTTDRVTAFDRQDELRCRVIENLVHLVVTNNLVTIKILTRLAMKPRSLHLSQR
ncbi:hypothetical protein BN903_192 [Halorubrum sp. AJ67]|nr:hypothetical protein BN903_192 [Halorubrum sp. AJ67]